MGHAASPGPLPPWGGYVNLLQQPQFSSIGENFHFVGHTHGFAPISPSPSPSAQRQPSSHAFFGVAGSNNDINVLNQSTLFIQELKGQAPRVQYMVNGHQYNTGYYLADGIYPEWAVFVKSISLPITEKDKLFAQQQESKRKDIERAFGVVRRRFCILKRPARLYDRGQLENVVLACIILHNMIVEDEKQEDIEENLDLNEPANTRTVEAPKFSPNDYVAFERVLEKDADIRDVSTHRQLKKDLVEHIWQRSRAR
ncbi:unnamed protein product [Urochloa humidicola]